MERLQRIILNIIFCIQVLLIFLLFFEDQIQLPAWLQVAGRMHPLVLHIPIGMMIFLVALLLMEKWLDQAVAPVIISFGLILTSLSASVTALFGFFLSLQGDYGADALTRHKVSGVLLSFLCYFVVLLYQQKKRQAIFFGAGLVCFVTLVVAGHTGAVLTHGENFVLAPMTRGEKPVLTVETASVYHFAVEPILEKKCFSCHNESKAKGGLIMTTVEKFKAGGKEGTAFTEGHPEASRMIKAFYLPLSDDKHMPPDGKPQLSSLEITTLKAWIKAGADFDKKLAEYKASDSLTFITTAFASSTTPDQENQVLYTFPGLSDDKVAKLNTPFRSVFPLYQNSPALQADFFVKKAFEVKAVEELKAAANQLVVVNLSRMPVTDKEIPLLATFKNLEQLNLNFTAITGSTLGELKALKNLKLLSLSGTAIKAKDLDPVLDAPALHTVYLWNTPVTDAEIEAFQKEHPKITFIKDSFHDNTILRLSKPSLENEGVVKRSDKVKLKHTMPGVTIRYTRDGTNPDSVNSTEFKEPFLATETFVIKARACKATWHCSDVYESTVFVEGIHPVKMKFFNEPDPQYPGEGVTSLMDHRKGVSDVLKEPSWVAYRDKPFAAGFWFDKEFPKSMVFSYARNLGAYSFPPTDVEVWAGKDEKDAKLIQRIKIEQPKGYDANKVAALTIPLSPHSYAFYKIVAHPVAKLPAWHDGKGDKGWVFFDEVFFY
ncbi:Uncharacterized membrane protein [Chryseolinea serpens]|uniref:Uncharacterized membrane protein n=1 Tax=Chryseolinea serpens TaxID=947013 RepID=A0A1M5VG76_9BACT|nr:c-type cytochrome domain-containing protein [Chryseolinea serpens]SHH73933.1 Uncharacterized membrane protein [Chryseolinea serpens]